MGLRHNAPFRCILVQDLENADSIEFPYGLESGANLFLYSPKDQATLEAEYKLNPKPNKAARAEIVEKVDLNEKEVQVSGWAGSR